MIEIRRGNAQAALARCAAVEKAGTISPFQVAQVYALRNDAKETFEWLDRAWSNRDTGIETLLYDPFILRYKDDPRFGAFCRKLGLPLPGGRQRASRADPVHRRTTASRNLIVRF